jgi:hypothetical protein
MCWANRQRYPDAEKLRQNLEANMSQRFTTVSSKRPILLLTASLLLAGATSGAAAAEELLSRSPERGGIGLDLQKLQFDEFSKIGKPSRGGLLNKLDERLSLIVTDKASTSAITFSEVMGKLADDMHVDKLTLFQRWWDTANEIPDGILDRATNVFCNSETDSNEATGLSKVNGFPYECPRAEGGQRTHNPFKLDDNGYTAIAFVSRFDLADKHSGRHCGEYRIVFAKNSGFTQTKDRNLIIFEALVPNPSPDQPEPDKAEAAEPGKADQPDPFAKLAGCRPIVEFWLMLSNTNMTPHDRGKALRNFFLDGLKADSVASGLPKDDIGPIVQTRHYAGGPASGQIRTNQFMEGRWTLREFKTYGGSIVPATVKSNPGNDLLSPLTLEDPRKRELENYLVNQALDDIRGIRSQGQKDEEEERSVFTFAFGLTTAGLDHLNSFDSIAESPAQGNVITPVEECRRVLREPLCPPLETRIHTELANAESPLSANNIIHRIGTQTCAGCHHYSNGDKELGVDCPTGWPDRLCFTVTEKGVEVRRGIWPSTLPDGDGFTHVSENDPGECGANEDVIDLGDLPRISLEELRRIRPERISHLSYMGPGGLGSRYRISETLKLVLIPPRFENMVLYLNNFPLP